MLKKLKLILSALICCGSGSYAQTAVITGNLTGLTQKELVFNYFKDGKNVLETVKVNNGKFKWVVKISEPQKVQTVLFDDYFYFYVETGNIHITGGDSISGIRIRGSKSQNEYELYSKMIKEIDAKLSALSQKWGKVSVEIQVELEKKIDDLYKQKSEKVNQFIAHYPKSAVSVNLILDNAVMENYNEVCEKFKKLDPIARQSIGGKRIAERLSTLKRSAIGAQMINFTQNDTEGQPVRFSDFIGKYVLIDFWASWCAPCRAENPNVLKAYNRFKDKNFTVIGISLDGQAEHWKKAIADDHMPWVQLSDLKGWGNEISTYFGIDGIPSTLLIDPQGKIVARNLSKEDLEKKLEELIK